MPKSGSFSKSLVLAHTFVLATVFAITQFSLSVIAEVPKANTFAANSSQFSMWSEYYKAMANYTRSGDQYAALPDGMTYQLLNIDFNYRRVSTASFAYSFGTKAASAASERDGIRRTNTSFVQGSLGAEYAFLQNKSSRTTIELETIFPFQRVKKTTENVLNSEGALEVIGKLRWVSTWGRFRPFLYGGINYRDEGRATLGLYGAALELASAKRFWGAGIDGYSTVVMDQYSANASEREDVKFKNGTALKFYTVNPNLLNASIWYRTNSPKGSNYFIAGESSVTGASTSAGVSLKAGLVIPLNEAPTRKDEPQRPIDDSQGEYQDSYDDGVDQSFFNK